MSWLQKLLPPRIKSTPGSRKQAMPEGLWVKCAACEAVVVPHAEHAEPGRAHGVLGAFDRAELLVGHFAAIRDA